MKFRILEEAEFGKWDEFIQGSPQGSLFSMTRYLECVKYPFRIGVVEQGGRIIGGMVLAKNELGVYANPLFVKYLGICYDPECDKNASARYKVDREIIRHLPKYVALRYAFHPTYRNWLNFFWERFGQTTHYTYQIDFTKNPDFRRCYDEKVKAPLRAARKNNLVIGKVNVEDFIEVNRLTYACRGNRPPYTGERLAGLIMALQDMGCLYKAAIRDEDGHVHAVAAIVYDHNSAHLILNGSRSEYRRYGGNTYLIDHMIEFASTHCKRFDFEGSMIERVERFYRGFGGEAVPYFVISRNNFATFAYDNVVRLIKKVFA